MREIDKEVFDDYGDYMDDIITDSRTNGLNQLPSQRDFRDKSIIDTDRHGNLKFKKHSKNKSKIKIGDRVSNGGITGEVIDVDGDLLCVETIDGKIQVWNLNKVKIKY